MVSDGIKVVLGFHRHYIAKYFKIKLLLYLLNKYTFLNNTSLRLNFLQEVHVISTSSQLL